MNLEQLLKDYGIQKKDISILLKKYDNINLILSESLDILSNIISIKSVLKLKTLNDLISLSLLTKINDNNDTFLSSPEAVAHYIRHEYGYKRKEYFSVLLLDNANKILATKILSIGTVNQAQVYPREILKACIEHDATSVIMVHNHPSGKCAPSGSDIILTDNCENLLNKIDILLHDHMITTNTDVFSIKANRKITL